MSETKMENPPRCPRCATKIRKERIICPGCGNELISEKLVTLPFGRHSGTKTIVKGKRAVSLCTLCMNSVPTEQLIEIEGNMTCPTCRDVLVAKAAKNHDPHPPTPPVV
jgi:predicted RNA-binding Zn-ribbon protein involved in translation (DUF1610 family)